MNTLNILNMLKRQPRIGTAPTPIGKDAADSRETAAAMEELQNTFQGLSATILEAYVKSIKSANDANTQLQTGLSSMIGVFDKYRLSQIELIKNATFLEQRNKSLMSSLRLSTKVAAELGESFDKMQESLGVNGDQLRQYGISINKMLPGMTKLAQKNEATYKGMLRTQHILRAQQGLTEDAVQNFELYAAGIGKTGETQLAALTGFAKEFEQQTGMIGIFGDVAQEVAGLGADIQMQFGKLPGTLELAVMKSRLLGMSVAQIAKAGEQSLNIEESINNELNYQLLSGKRLVDSNNNSIMEKLRLATITGDILKQEEAMADVYETQEDILKGTNMFAKAELAKTLGMTTQELMKGYQAKKLAEAQISDADVKKILQLKPEEFAKEMAKKSADVQAALKIAKDEYDTRSTDERFAEIIDQQRGLKVYEAANLAGGQSSIIAGSSTSLIEKMPDASADFLNSILPKNLANNEILKPIGMFQLTGQQASNVSVGFTELASKIPFLTAAIDSITGGITNKLTSLTGGTGGAFKMSATSADISIEKASISTVGQSQDDAVIMNDGIVKFNPRDKFMQVNDSTMIAGTNVDGNKQLARAITGGSSIDPRPIATAVASAIRDAMAGLSIEIDGEKLNKSIEFANRSINT